MELLFVPHLASLLCLSGVQPLGAVPSGWLPTGHMDVYDSGCPESSSMQKQMARAGVPTLALTPYVLKIVVGTIARLAKSIRELPVVPSGLEDVRV